MCAVTLRPSDCPLSIRPLLIFLPQRSLSGYLPGALRCCAVNIRPVKKLVSFGNCYSKRFIIRYSLSGRAPRSNFSSTFLRESLVAYTAVHVEYRLWSRLQAIRQQCLISKYSSRITNREQSFESGTMTSREQIYLEETIKAMKKKIARDAIGMPFCCLVYHIHRIVC